MLIEWKQFVSDLGKDRDIQLDRYELKQFIKTEDKDFPSYKILSTYFVDQFAQKTISQERSKWHWMDKAVLIWTMFKHVKQSKGTIIKPAEDNYSSVASLLGLSLEQIKIKWMSLLKTKVRESPWTQFEDDLILDLKKHFISDACWTQLSLEFNSKNIAPVVRYAKQIRERWNNFLNPNIKKFSWPVEEKIILLQKVQIEGKKWSRISKHLPGRTDNQVKNQFNIILNFFNRRNNDVKNEKEIILIAIKGLIDLIPDQTIKSQILEQDPLQFTTTKTAQQIEEPSLNKKLKIQKHEPSNQRTADQIIKKIPKSEQKKSLNTPVTTPVQEPNQQPSQFQMFDQNLNQPSLYSRIVLPNIQQQQIIPNIMCQDPWLYQQQQFMQSQQMMQNQQLIQQQHLIQLQQIVQHQKMLLDNQYKFQQVYQNQIVKREDF